MNKAGNDITGLTANQRAYLEMRLLQMRQGRAGATTDTDQVEENLVLAQSVEKVDELLSKFYGRFPWPWQPMKFDYLDDPNFEIFMLNQDIGDWGHQTIGENPNIWVAGCGTNQAINVALRFPTARVVGSDISPKSLDICKTNAAQMNIRNLEIKEESINNVTYKEEFDYIVCTGVIHHNADPSITLKQLTRALKPDGIIEILVYNRYHRIVTSAFQKAIRIFSENNEAIDFEYDLGIAKRIVEYIPAKESLESGFIHYMDYSESDFADLLIQPVEHSYTVESLEAMVDCCGLELLLPCISLYAKSLATSTWNLEFNEPTLQALYAALPDSRRWQVTNLILHEKSPMLWFYLKRKDSRRKRKSEKQICEDFLDMKFRKNRTRQRCFIRGEDGTYRKSPHTIPYPPLPAAGPERDLLDIIDEGMSLRAAYRRLKREPTFQEVSRARMKLASSAYPYLKATSVC
jgi:SAM-dependent methyltransferase